MRPTIDQILADMGLERWSIELLSESERKTCERTILVSVASRHGWNWSDTALRSCDLEMDRTAILGQLIEMMSPSHGNYDPLQRGVFHEVYLQLARIEEATGLDLTSDNRLNMVLQGFLKGALQRIDTALFAVQWRTENGLHTEAALTIDDAGFHPAP